MCSTFFVPYMARNKVWGMGKRRTTRVPSFCNTHVSGRIPRKGLVYVYRTVVVDGVFSVSTIRKVYKWVEYLRSGVWASMCVVGCL